MLSYYIPFCYDLFKQPVNLGKSHTSTTLSSEVWRLAKSKAFKVNVPNFQPPEGVVAPLLSFWSCFGDNWTLAHRNFYERGQSEVGSKVEGIRLVSSKNGMWRYNSLLLLLWGQTCSLQIAWLMQMVGWHLLALSLFPLLITNSSSLVYQKKG